ncbi:F-box only protein 33-like [Rhagoletis pomonella]|uniref:F-box only protein 33-like n=1 Tax=Rhagoletis pomonella TaxID=28610 RepID=UPI0017833431|nr:F-box only protein 33-like [Rhagoletis pomonella]XP_036336622.1 F-box only protein 33-like [Rhagoletis pomonella]
MSRCVTPEWDRIPTLVLGNIYEYLEPRDRLNASQTCRHWRGVLFQKRFFDNFKLKLHVNNERQCTFFRQTLCNLATEVTLIFDFLNVFHIEKIRRILYRIARCDNLQGLHFYTNNVGLIPPGDISEESLVDIEQCFVEPLKMFLNRKKYPCQILDLGAIEALTYYGLDVLKALSKPEALQQLTLASIKFDPSHYPIFTLETTLLQKCTSLQVLSLDYDTLNDELLRAMEILPLKKLLICIHGLDRQHPGISDVAWTRFGASFPNIELIVSLVYAFEAVEVLQVRILRHNMPITHLRVLFCDFMNVEALEWMSVNNSNTLKSIQWIDSAYKHSDKNVMDLFLRSGQDPFVMMSWRCKNLEEIVIHGYVLDPHNIVGISRLRGHTLKRLEVSMIDNTPTEASMDSFIEEINTLLGQKWEPLNPNTLHPALGYIPVSDDVRDEYVFDLMRRDMGY